MSQKNSSDIVSEKHQEIRLDRFLLIHLPNFSRSALQRLIKAGHVTVNGKVRTPHYLLRIGEKVEYSLPKAPKKVDTSRISLPIVYEDANFFVMDKPAGIAVETSRADTFEMDSQARGITLADVLEQRRRTPLSTNKRGRQAGYLARAAWPANFRFGMVHRLDKDTSGLLIVAKNEKTQTYFQKLFHDRKIEKEYTALVFGHLEPKKGIIEAPLTRSDRDRKKILVSANPDARYAVTHYEVVQYFPFGNLATVEEKAGRHTSVISHGKQSGVRQADTNSRSKGDVSLVKAPSVLVTSLSHKSDVSFTKSLPPLTLLRVMPKTGRTHQIRVHFSAIGYPIVGDTLYGNTSLNKFFEQKTGLRRQFLHATALKFVNPGTRKKQVVKCELAKDLQEVLDRLLSH